MRLEIREVLDASVSRAWPFPEASSFPPWARRLRDDSPLAFPEAERERERASLTIDATLSILLSRLNALRERADAARLGSLALAVVCAPVVGDDDSCSSAIEATREEFV